MLSISHAATGAFIATKIQNPYLAIPLILASHYLEDAVPHWDIGTGLSSGKKSPRDAFLGEIPDLLLSAIVVVAMFPSTLSLFTHFDPSSLITTSAPIWGAFFGLLPDFLEAPRNFLKKEPLLLRPINRFHHSFHHSIPRPLSGLLPQIILLSLLWYFK